MRNAWIFLFIMLCGPYLAWGADCRAALMLRPKLISVIAQLEKLNPEFTQTLGVVRDPERIYLALKTEEELFRRAKGLPRELIARITELRGQAFRFADLPEASQVQFYLNLLRGHYINVAEEWKEAEIEGLVEGPLTHTQKGVAAALLGSYFRPFGLHDPDFSKVSAERAFSEAKWLEYPWPRALKLIADYETTDLANKERFSRQKFEEWLDTQPPTGLTADQSEALTSAFYNFSKYRRCCELGCHACPQNYKWLKQKL